MFDIDIRYYMNLYFTNKGKCTKNKIIMKINIAFDIDFDVRCRYSIFYIDIRYQVSISIFESNFDINIKYRISIILKNQNIQYFDIDINISKNIDDKKN